MSPDILTHKNRNYLHTNKAEEIVNISMISKVYCMNKHNVGRVEYTSYCMQRKQVYRLLLEKNTFIENFLKK